MDDVAAEGYDAIVLAGGRARRLDGVDKPGLHIGGTSLLDRVLAAVPGAGTVVCVGPRRATAREVAWCREDPPGGGPVAGLARGMPLTSAATLVVLAADLPAVAPGVRALLAALAAGDADATVLVDDSGRANHLAAAWRRPALLAALAALGDPVGAPVRALGASVRLVGIADPSGWGRDCDTWDEIDAARAALGDGLPGTGMT